LFVVLYRRQVAEFAVSAGRIGAERAYALSDVIERLPEITVLLLEHQVEAPEFRAFDIPVEVVRLQIEEIRVGEHSG
jgi:hypothetical protein